MSSDFSISGPRVNTSAPIESTSSTNIGSEGTKRLLVQYNKAQQDKQAVSNLSKKAAALRQEVAGLKNRLKELQPGTPEAKRLVSDLQAKQAQLQATETELVALLGASMNSPAASALRAANDGLEALEGQTAGLKADLAAVGQALAHLDSAGQAGTLPHAALALRQELLQGQLDSALAMREPLMALRQAAADALQLEAAQLIAQQEVDLLQAQDATPPSAMAAATERLQQVQQRLATAKIELARQDQMVTHAHSTQSANLQALYQQLMPRCDALMAQNKDKIEQTAGAAVTLDLGSELQDLKESISSLDTSDPGEGGADEGVAASGGAEASEQDD